MLSESDRQALADALCEAFEKSAPLLSQALSDALQAQFERVIGRGVVGWTKRILIAGRPARAGRLYLYQERKLQMNIVITRLLALAGYTFTKSGSFK
ncbi:hypothetical protein [Xanthomonas sp. MUS 060]|uniref:hypothetical protein n=1 Tax=Xanthomonas sp. MUS 060 TaxID=1588031 RepID=UPI0005F29597|nr:hypothetical protein [Xanthomonas sp. MUS 060]